MTHSYRKTACCGITTAVSEKQDKRNANRKFRRINKEIVNRNKEDIEPKQKRELSNSWDMDKDGKMYFDAKAYPKLLRK